MPNPVPGHTRIDGSPPRSAMETAGSGQGRHGANRCMSRADVPPAGAFATNRQVRVTGTGEGCGQGACSMSAT